MTSWHFQRKTRFHCRQCRLGRGQSRRRAGAAFSGPGFPHGSQADPGHHSGPDRPAPARGAAEPRRPKASVPPGCALAPSKVSEWQRCPRQRTRRGAGFPSWPGPPWAPRCARHRSGSLASGRRRGAGTPDRAPGPWGLFGEQVGRAPRAAAYAPLTQQGVRGDFPAETFALWPHGFLRGVCSRAQTCKPHSFCVSGSAHPEMFSSSTKHLHQRLLQSDPKCPHWGALSDSLAFWRGGDGATRRVGGAPNARRCVKGAVGKTEWPSAAGQVVETAGSAAVAGVGGEWGSETAPVL